VSTALLDTSIYPSTVTHDATAARHVALRGGRLVIWVDETPIRRRLRGKTQEESDAIYRSLHQMAEMEREGAHILYLHLPALRGSQFDVFRGVKRRIAQGPLRRTYVIEGCFSEGKRDSPKSSTTGTGGSFLKIFNILVF
jgi:hypothetical protein